MALAQQGFYKAALLLLMAVLFLQASVSALGSKGKLCYSRQHRDAIVNVRVAVESNGAVTSTRVKQAEKDCILACCSEEVEPGIKCNMVVYKPSSQPGNENCYLFHCESEQDCPLMSAKPGINTYDISKDMIHPTLKGNGRATVMPFIRATLGKQLISTQSTSTNMRPTTPTIRIAPPPTTTTKPQPTTSTTQPTTTTTASTTLPTTTTTEATTLSTTTTTTQPPTDPSIILVTMPVVTMPSTNATTKATTTTTTTTTQLTSTTVKTPSTTPTITTPTTTQPPQQPQPPQPPAKPIRPSKKPLKPPKKNEPQAGKSATKSPTTTTTTTTTTQKTTITSTTPPPTTTTIPTTITTSTTTTSTTSTTTTTTTTACTATTERTTVVVVEMNDLKNGASGPDGLMPPAEGSSPDKTKGLQMTWKNGLVAVVVVMLICLTLVLAIVGRKAMESFDRRHYTRLELNDLHYEI